jgi:O-antigen chain-terminating methyltransferase
LVLLETINPHCPPALNWFYMDPTHVRPVPGDLLRFMLEQAGFTQVSFVFSSPLAGANVDPVLRTATPSPETLAAYQDYAVVAVRG